jgi:hypothetical protein
MSLAIDSEYDLVNAVLLRRPFHVSTNLLLDFYDCYLCRETSDTLFLLSQTFYQLANHTAVHES